MLRTNFYNSDFQFHGNHDVKPVLDHAEFYEVKYRITPEE